MDAAGVPTAASRTFTDLRRRTGLRRRATPSRWWSRRRGSPPARARSSAPRGRGAATRVRAMLGEGRFGDAGRTVVIEEFLDGEELSVLGAHQRRGRRRCSRPRRITSGCGEGDTGPNTGGMGAYSPVSVATPALLDRVRTRGARPDAAEMRRRGSAIRRRALRRTHGGRRRHCHASWSSTAASAIRRLRWCSRSCRADSPSVSGGWRHGEGARRSRHRQEASVTTVLAARGYPEDPEKGAAITIPAALPRRGASCFHAGTTRDRRASCEPAAAGCST